MTEGTKVRVMESAGRGARRFIGMQGIVRTTDAEGAAVQLYDGEFEMYFYFDELEVIE